MDKRQKNILAWVLIWAGLLLLVLYSPVGSPDLYSNREYYAANQGVVFDGVGIENAGSVPSSSNNGSQSFSVPEQTKTGGSSYSISSGSFVDTQQGFGSGSMSGGVEFRQNKGGSGSGGGFGVSSMGSKGGSKSVSSSQNFGSAFMSTDLTQSSENNTSKQGVGYTPGSGATDPGDDPTGPPIPVGDGWLFLLVLSFFFVIWKTLRYRHSTVKH